MNDKLFQALKRLRSYIVNNGWGDRHGMLYARDIMNALCEERRDHIHRFAGSWYCCGACPLHEDRTPGECDCGADAWNARLDAVLGGGGGVEYNEACATCGVPADVHRSADAPPETSPHAVWGWLTCRAFVHCVPPRAAYGATTS